MRYYLKTLRFVARILWAIEWAIALSAICMIFTLAKFFTADHIAGWINNGNISLSDFWPIALILTVASAGITNIIRIVLTSRP